MPVMRTTKSPAYPLGELIRTEQPIELHDPPFAVNPLGLYSVQPRTLLGKQATHDPRALFLAVFDLSVVFAEPPPDLPGYVPALAFSQMSRRTFYLPIFSSPSKHHERNCVVMELTGLPSTNLIHMSLRVCSGR